MPPMTWADFERSLRRSPARKRVLLALASLSISHANPLARAAEVDWAQLMGVLHGRPPKYRPELGLLPMGLARVVQTPNGRAYEITERGRRKARQLASRGVRAQARRRAARRAGERRPGGSRGHPAADDGMST